MRYVSTLGENSSDVYYRQVKFPGELEDIYEVLFAPMRVSRMLFKRMVSLEYAQVSYSYSYTCISAELLCSGQCLKRLFQDFLDILGFESMIIIIPDPESARRRGLRHAELD